MNPRSTVEETAVPVAIFTQIDAACDRFENAYLAGRIPDLALYVDGIDGEARGPLFRHLLSLDLEYRLRRGERPNAQQYRERFPELSEVVDSVFRALSERPIFDSTVEPDAETDRNAGPLNATRRKGFDGGPGASWGGLGPAERAELKSAGYEVGRQIGRGGMGVIYEARQVSLNRFVALKLIRSGGFASDSEMRRFQNEAEAVAQLDHPHIVPIYEVAQVGGRPFFSMKLIAGTGIDRKLAEFAADPRATARLVATVAQAIHHAHQRGILHRDLKPANILLDENDEPQVTDFGLAKRIDGDAELTHSNTLLGTPSYMAPEQTARGRGGVSTATDVYGLGTILYALLASRAPFCGTTLVETLDMVRTQYPEPPSRLNPNVPRDLDVICRKCLDKEPGRRYASALALSDDLSRWLRGEPILARPVGPFVRAIMWGRRNPSMAVAAAVALLLLVAGVATVTWKWREAVRERARADSVVELLTQRLFVRADSELNSQGRNPTVRDLLDGTASALGGWLDGQPDVEAQVRETLGGAYLSLDQFKAADQQLRLAINLDARANGPGGRTGLHAISLRATLLDRTGRTGEAEPLLRQNLIDCRRFLGPDDSISLDAAERLGVVLWNVGKLDEAEAMLRRNLVDRERVFKPEHPQTLRSVYLLSRLLRERRRLGEAEELAYRYAHDIQCARGSNHPDWIAALTNRGDVARDRGELAAAERFYRQAADDAGRVLGPEHAATRAARANLGQFHTGK